MLLWRRNVKISHYTVGVGPIETGLLYVVITGWLILLENYDFCQKIELKFVI